MADIVAKRHDVYGKSTFQISEVKMTNTPMIITVDGQNIRVLPIIIRKNGIKCYCIIEKYEGNPITCVDLVYGEIDLKRFNSEEHYRNYVLDGLTRGKLENIVRTQMGILIPSRTPREEASDTAKYMVLSLSDVFRSNPKDVSVARYSVAVDLPKEMFEDKKPKKEKKKTIFDSFIEDLKDFAGEPPKKETKPKKATLLKDTLYFPTGGVIIDGVPCQKYSYVMQSKQVYNGSIINGTQMISMDSFFVSGIDLDRIAEDEEYAMAFNKSVAESGVVESLRLLRLKRNADFAFLGKFDGKTVMPDIKIEKLVTEMNGLNPAYSDRSR